jgi:acetoin utilization protein AcuC
MPRPPLLIGSEIYRGSRYGADHPLAIPRVSTALDLIRAMGWLDEARYRDSPRATVGDLGRFHDPAYLAALQDAERDQDLDEIRRKRHAIGTLDNPIFAEIFRRPATAAGGSILAARLIADGIEDVVHNPAGGTHHGRPDRASGFCYLNDVVLGILGLLDRGLAPILYVDIDAHHGDGVQDAFADDPRVFTVSTHQARRWPFSGGIDDRGGGRSWNLPVPPGFNDAEMALIRERVVLPLLDRVAPAAVVLQSGADAVADDPLSRLELSNRAIWDMVAALRDRAPRFLVLGGGGYNPWSVARCWAGNWAVLNGFDPAAPLTPEARAILGGLTWKRLRGAPPDARLTERMDDPPNPAPAREEVLRLVEQAAAP